MTIKQITKNMNLKEIVKNMRGLQSGYDKVMLDLFRSFLNQYINENDSFILREAYKLVSDFMSESQFRIYYGAIRYYSKNMEGFLTRLEFGRVYYANTSFGELKYQELLIEAMKDGKFKKSDLANNPSMILKDAIPELRSKFDSIIHLMESIYKFRSISKKIDINIKKMNNFEKLKLFHEYSYFKKDMDNIIKKPKSKSIWKIKVQSQSALNRLRKLFDEVEEVDREFAIKVREEELLKKIDKLNRFRCEIV